MIEAYFLQIETILQSFPNIRFVSLTKKIYNTNQGYISVSIIFENNHRLDFIEVKNTDVKAKIKYRYHYMDEHQVMIFRYDNAPHHIINRRLRALRQVQSQLLTMYFWKLPKNKGTYRLCDRLRLD
jgi:hypothetical protein